MQVAGCARCRSQQNLTTAASEVGTVAPAAWQCCAAPAQWPHCPMSELSSIMVSMQIVMSSEDDH